MNLKIQRLLGIKVLKFPFIIYLKDVAKTLYHHRTINITTCTQSHHYSLVALLFMAMRFSNFQERC
jgi:hypothetical protein